MKKSNVLKLREMKTEELTSKLVELQKEYARNRMLHAIGKLKNVRSLTMGRKTQAVIQTIIHERKAV